MEKELTKKRKHIDQLKPLVQQTLGNWTKKHEQLCIKAFNKRLNISDTLSYLILNS